MKILFILNSDFGVQNTIGARALPIAKQLKKVKENNLLVLSRGYNKEIKKDFNIKRVVPLGQYVMKFLTGVPIYISKKLNTNPLKKSIFEAFLIRKLKKLNLKDIDIIHSWDFLPKTYEYIKKANPNITIIQDVAIALPSILKSIKDKEQIWKDESLETPTYIKESFGFTDLFIAPSDFVKDSLIKESINKSKIHVIPFGVDVSKFRPVKKDYNATFTAAFIGNITSRKGIKYLIQAWSELGLKNAKLNLYGRVYPEVYNLFEKAPENNIKAHGFTDITKKLPKNLIYIFPSLQEGSSKSIYEAMASGLPIITTPNSGSVIRDKKDGFILPIQDVKALKEKILFFYNNRKKIEGFGKNARLQAKKFTWEHYSKKIVELYGKFND